MKRLTHLLLHDARHRLLWRVLLLACVLITAWFAFMPSDRLPTLSDIDKVNHALAFTLMAVCAALSFAARRRWRTAGLIVLALLAYGGFIEVVQSFLPTRQGDWADLAADALGIALGLSVAGIARAVSGPASG